MIISPFRLQILIAFTIESGKSFAYLFRRAFIFLLEQSHYFCETIVGKPSKFVRWERLGRRRKCPALSASFPFPCPPEIRFTQTAPLIYFGSLNIVECTGSTQSECALIKTRKLLGDYSSENSECNRRELRTLEIHFLESV